MGTVKEFFYMGTRGSLNPFKYYQGINASLLHLNENSIAMTARDKDFLNKLPIMKMHVRGGGIKFSGLRVVENIVTPNSNLKYVATNAIQNMDRKM